MFGPFERPEGVNPIFSPNPDAVFECPMRGETVRWEEMATFNPAAVVRDGKIHVLYRAEDRLGEAIIGGHTSRIGLAWSDDGLHFTRRPAPVLYPDDDDQKGQEWPGGCEDPRIVETEEGTYVLMYTQWNHVRPQLAVATSTDLISWDKHGPLFPDLDRESKAGSIVSRVEGNRLVATRIDGSYWMYWSVPDVYIARSDDLIHWTPVRDDRGDLLRVLNPRPGYFDSWLVEPGPPAILTEHGILLIYNAGNSGVYGDPGYGHRMYTGGQALYDRENPMRLIGRTDEPFIWPEMPYEKTGQYPEGTTFLEGMVPFQGKWFLYYGTADSRVAVAVWDPDRPAPPSFQEGLP
jgi:beta-1,2-mannosidase